MKTKLYHILNPGFFSIAMLFLLLITTDKTYSQTTETFTTDGTFTVPAGVTSITVECWGAGGGGATMTINDGGGGAGGGAYASSDITVSPGNNFSIVVGAGGGPGVDGGNSSFDGSVVIAAGGKGVSTDVLTGGIGGLASESTGTTKYNGGTGTTTTGANNGGGGGGGAGSTGPGGDGSGTTGGTGAALNGGNGGNGGIGAPGGTGNNYGGGGGGAFKKQTGGTGADGYVTVTYTQAASPPTITLGANPSVVEGTTSANLTYSATTDSPDQYSIDYDVTAQGQGFVDVSLATLPASPILLVVPGAAAPATYDAILTVTNSSTGLTSGNYAITVTITPGTPTITLTDANPSIVQGTTTADVTYSATTFSPDQYSIDYDATAEGQGFVDVTLAALPVSPIVLTIPGAAAVDTYNGTLTVRNSSTGAVSGNYAITVTVTAAPIPPTITLIDANPSVVEGTTSANITYSGTTDNPDQYSINYNATAEGQGFIDVSLDALPASPIVLVVPGAAAPATYDAILTVRNSSTGLTSGNYAITVTITPGTPTITLTDANPSVVQGTTTTDVTYSATTFSPDQYSIDYDATAEGQGFVDVTLAALPVSPIVLTVPGAAAIDTYNGTLTVKNSSTGQVSSNYAITVTVTAAPSPPTITLGTNPSVVEGTTSANLTYSATTDSPDQYSIDYDATAEGQGFVDVTLAALPASPIVLVVPGAAAIDTYNGTLTVKNSSSGEVSGNYAITVTVTAAASPPTITLGANPSVVAGTTSANLTYSATTDSPDQYSINYDVTAEGQGFVDVTLAALPASPIVLVVPGAATPATYNGTLTVKNSSTGLISGNYPITVTITNSPPTITLTDPNPTAVTGGTSTNLIYIATTNSPDQYSIDYDSAANTAGFVDVSLASLPASPIVLVVPGAAALNTYNGTLTVKNSATGLTSSNYPITVTVTDVTDHSLTNCTSCHITHNSPGTNLTSIAGNALLCQSCHTDTGAASRKSVLEADNGTSSHAWNVLAENTGKETVLPSDTQMALRIITDGEGDKIICSTCHNQHKNGSLGNPYLRVDNPGDALCKDCHSARDVGIYSDAPATNKGSHPVGITQAVDSRFQTPTNTQLVAGKVECSSCHGTHDVTGTLGLATNGNLLRTTNNVNLCTDCHTYGTHNNMDCLDCHTVHNTVANPTTNIYIIKNTITTPNSGDKPVVFTAESGPTGSFAGTVDGNYNGVCEVCHTTTAHFQNDGTSTDQIHTSQPGNVPEANCTTCHPHSSDFAPSGGDCVTCHQTEFPTWQISDGHVAHTTKYNFDCSTCHFERGSGTQYHLFTDPLDVTDGEAEVNFNPNGLSTRNGQDGNSPTFNGDKSCDNIYCHSNGKTADRGTDGTYTWGAKSGDGLPFGGDPLTYATAPAWDVGTITSCRDCHGGLASLPPDPYDITDTGPYQATVLADYPNTGGHGPRTTQHFSGNEANWGGGHTQCFWCHDVDDRTAAGGVKKQGTYGTSFHVDGETHFTIGWTNEVPPGTGNVSVPRMESSGHCSGKNCWSGG